MISEERERNQVNAVTAFSLLPGESFQAVVQKRETQVLPRGLPELKIQRWGPREVRASGAPRAEYLRGESFMDGRSGRLQGASHESSVVTDQHMFVRKLLEALGRQIKKY